MSLRRGCGRRRAPSRPGWRHLLALCKASHHPEPNEAGQPPAPPDTPGILTPSCPSNSRPEPLSPPPHTHTLGAEPPLAEAVHPERGPAPEPPPAGGTGAVLKHQEGLACPPPKTYKQLEQFLLFGRSAVAAAPGAFLGGGRGREQEALPEATALGLRSLPSPPREASGGETGGGRCPGPARGKRPMAASEEVESALGQLGQEATCPLCLDFFQQPMVLACGHNFCHPCLAQLGAEASCPQCRARVEPGSAHPNRALANIVGLVKGLPLSGGAQEGSSDPQLCRKHQLPLQTFCSSEKLLLCAGCLGGHQGHPLLSLPEAAREYKVLLDALLEPLKKEEQQLLEQWRVEKQSRQECQEQLATEKQKVGLALGSLVELLQERLLVWVAWLAEQEEKMEAEWVGPLAQLSGEASRLQQLIAQMERKCRQPDWEFLQDIQDTVYRCRSYVVGRVESVSSGLQGRVQTILEKSAPVRQVVDNYKASLEMTLTRKKLERPLAMAVPQPVQGPQASKVYITMDGSTAHPRLYCQGTALSLADQNQNVPDLPGRFDQEWCALGCGGFSAGWHCWQVSVQEAGNAPVCGRACWALGVALESVRRKGSLQLSPQEGIWAVGKSVEGETVAFSKVHEKLSLQRPLRNLWVRLDYKAEEVEFLDVDTGASLYTFRTGAFFGERACPFFYLGQAGVTLQCEVYRPPTTTTMYYR
ncbi:E3 ubiquitin-protein ligase TRIM7-like isoform 2-T2 [Vipera latastei]